MKSFCFKKTPPVQNYLSSLNIQSWEDLKTDVCSEASIPVNVVAIISNAYISHLEGIFYGLIF